MLLSQLSLPSYDLSAGCDFLFLPVVAAASHLLLKALQANALRKTLVNLLFCESPSRPSPPTISDEASLSQWSLQNDFGKEMPWEALFQATVFLGELDITGISPLEREPF